MCGIAGILHLDGRAVERTALAKMGEAIIHRGPDGHGDFTDGPLGLVHRRLAIIDLSPGGRQPMTTTDGRHTIVFNGEIYNFRELKDQLERLGRRFTSRSDTEVLLQAWAEWGTACLPKLNGMFAFAVWDATTQELAVARDRYGIKPLYWSQHGKSFRFASESKAILADPDQPRRLDLEACLEYFTFQNLFTDRTLHQGIQLLPPASWMKLRPGQLDPPQIQRWWDWQFQEPTGPVDDRELEEELDRLLRQAISRQLVSDVDVGAYLSGGMDSGTITAIASRQLPHLRTFTCGFDLSSASGMELAFDERARAERMSYLFKTEQYEVVLKAGDMERCLPDLIRHLEEPRIGQSYPNYHVAGLASRFVKVVLSGAGGDECFGGYPWRYYRGVASTSFTDYTDRYYDYWQRLIPSRLIPQVFAPIWDSVKHVSTRNIFSDVFRNPPSGPQRPEDYLNLSMYFEARTFLHGLLVVEDKLSMAHGLEARVPFLDNDLVDFAMRLPARLKIANLDQPSVSFNENTPAKRAVYQSRHNDGKLLLRSTMARHLPHDIAAGEKQGFSGPDGSWFKGESIEYVKRTLMQRRSPIYQIMDFNAVSDLIREHLSGTTNRRLLIWSLLSLHHFLEQMEPRTP